MLGQMTASLTTLPTPVLTEIALRTATIRLVSGVLSVWGRTAATLAMTAATLHQVSGGRYVLGLGDQVRPAAHGLGPDRRHRDDFLPPGLPWPAIEATLLAAAPDRATEVGPGLAEAVK